MSMIREYENHEARLTAIATSDDGKIGGVSRRNVGEAVSFAMF